jgi:hypothetical protein
VGNEISQFIPLIAGNSQIHHLGAGPLGQRQKHGAIAVANLAGGRRHGTWNQLISRCQNRNLGTIDHRYDLLSNLSQNADLDRTKVRSGGQRDLPTRD